jgi:plastocyanin
MGGAAVDAGNRSFARLGITGIVLFGALPLIALAGAVGAHAGDTTVTIVSGSGSQNYSPSPLTINPGDTVRWVNNDAYPHNATCSASECPEAWSSGPADTGPNKDVGSHTFRYSGRYTYHCVVHGNMTGVIDVTGNIQPPRSSAATPGAHQSPAAPTAPSAGVTPGGPAAQKSSSPGGGGYGAGGYTAGGQAAGDSSAAPSLVGLALPRPEVRVEQVQPKSTPLWVLGLTMVLAVAAAAVFGVAWFAPRRARGGPST